MLLSTLQTFANCRSSPAQHTPGTCALRWLGIRTHGEECGGEGQREAVVRKKKIKSDRQTGREQPVDRDRNVRDEGSGSQRMHKCYKCGDRRQRVWFLLACTSYYCSVMLLLVPMHMVASEGKDQKTTRPACSEVTAHPPTQQRTSKQNDGFRRETDRPGCKKKPGKTTNTSAEHQWESNTHTRGQSPAFMPWLPIRAESHLESLQTHHALSMHPFRAQEWGRTQLAGFVRPGFRAEVSRDQACLIPHNSVMSCLSILYSPQHVESILFEKLYSSALLKKCYTHS